MIWELGKSGVVLDQVVNSGARTRSRYNAPQGINSKSRPASRRWSPQVGNKNPIDYSEFPLSETNFWTVIVTITAGCGPVVTTYTCNCPDYSKQITGRAGYGGDNPDDTDRKFTPRIFPASAATRYKSNYMRWLRARSIIAYVQFIGIQAGNQYIYRIPTQVAEKYTRNWSSSNAGPKPGQDCKHIIAVRIVRGETVAIPTDVPDFLGYEDLLPSFYEE